MIAESPECDIEEVLWECPALDQTGNPPPSLPTLLAKQICNHSQDTPSQEPNPHANIRRILNSCGPIHSPNFRDLSIAEVGTFLEANAFTSAQARTSQ